MVNICSIQIGIKGHTCIHSICKFTYAVHTYITKANKAITMTTGLNGQVAIVTGSARGIGRGFVEILLENGAKVTMGMSENIFMYLFMDNRI